MAVKVTLDDGRITLIIGSSLLLAYCLIEATLHSLHMEAVWPGLVALHVLRDFGVAFIVAGAVSLGIERLSREKLNREIRQEIGEIKKDRESLNKDVREEIKNVERNFLNSAYLKSYPESYTSMVKDMLQSEVFCRIGLNVDIDIQLSDPTLISPASDDLIIYDQISSGRVKNISNAPQVFNPKIFLGKDWDLKIPELLAWKVGDKELNADEIAQSDKSTPDSKFTKWFEFPQGVTLNPGDELYTYSKVRNYKRARDVTAWSGLLAADSLRFSVTHPPNFEVFVQAKTRNRGNAYPLTSDGRRVTVEIFGGTLPHAAVELGWRPIQEP